MKKALFSWVLTAVCGGLLVTSCGVRRRQEAGAGRTAVPDNGSNEERHDAGTAVLGTTDG